MAQIAKLIMYQLIETVEIFLQQCYNSRVNLPE